MVEKNEVKRLILPQPNLRLIYSQQLFKKNTLHLSVKILSNTLQIAPAI